MSRPPTDLPERLLHADATDFERRLLNAARRKGPPPATSARVAQALGVTVTIARSFPRPRRRRCTPRRGVQGGGRGNGRGNVGRGSRPACSRSR